MRKTLVIVGTLIATLFLGLFAYTAAYGKLPTWNIDWHFFAHQKNGTPKTTDSSSITFSSSPQEYVPRRMYVFADHQLSSYEPVSKTSEILSTFASTVSNVTVSPNLDVYAYLSTNGKKDTLSLRYRGSSTDAVVYTADHSFTGEKENQSLRLQAPIRFSPDGRYLMVRQFSWEGCEDILVTIATKKITQHVSCDALAWSGDSREVAMGNGLGYDGPIQFSYGSPNDIDHLYKPDWQSMSGDNTDFLDEQHQPRWANATPTFAEDGTILLVVTWTGEPRSNSSGSTLYRYNPHDNSIHRITNIPDLLFNGRVIVTVNQAVVMSTSAVYVVDLSTNTYKRVTSGLLPIGTSFVQLLPYTSPYVIMVSTDTGEDGAIVNSRLDLLEVTDRTVGSVFSSTDKQFAGWSPVGAPSRDLEYLRQDFTFADLSGSQKKVTDAHIENMKLYTKDPTEQLGGLDCGTSEKHDQLQALNDAVFGSYMLYDGLKVSVTPNLYHWNNVDMAQWLNTSGEEVVCGVSTTTPRFIADDTIYWWKGCVGGAGIGQPGDSYFEQSIRCAQAEDLIQRHFGLQ